MVKLLVELDFPGRTKEELQELVHLLDEIDSGLGEGIAPEHVQPMHFFEYLFTDRLGFGERQWIEAVIENMPLLFGVEVPYKPDLEKDTYTVLQNEWED